MLVISDEHPHKVVGSDFYEKAEGTLINKIYSDTGIRVNVESIIDDGKRVVIITVPGRPIGKLIKFEGVPLMRTGESLREMSDEEMFKILSEQEPDFSSTICKGLTMSDLNKEAITIAKLLYAVKQKNPGFADLNNLQALVDLDVMRGGKLTYAALILFGEKETIAKHLPQASHLLNIDRQILIYTLTTGNFMKSPSLFQLIICGIL